jgi:hypothetical protein
MTDNTLTPPAEGTPRHLAAAEDRADLRRQLAALAARVSALERLPDNSRQLSEAAYQEQERRLREEAAEREARWQAEYRRKLQAQGRRVRLTPHSWLCESGATVMATQTGEVLYEVTEPAARAQQQAKFAEMERQEREKEEHTRQAWEARNGAGAGRRV